METPFPRAPGRDYPCTALHTSIRPDHLKTLGPAGARALGSLAGLQPPLVPRPKRRRSSSNGLPCPCAVPWHAPAEPRPHGAAPFRCTPQHRASAQSGPRVIGSPATAFGVAEEYSPSGLQSAPPPPPSRRSADTSEPFPVSIGVAPKPRLGPGDRLWPRSPTHGCAGAPAVVPKARRRKRPLEGPVVQCPHSTSQIGHRARLCPPLWPRPTTPSLRGRAGPACLISPAGRSACGGRRLAAGEGLPHDDGVDRGSRTGGFHFCEGRAGLLVTTRHPGPPVIGQRGRVEGKCGMGPPSEPTQQVAATGRPTCAH